MRIPSGVEKDLPRLGCFSAVGDLVPGVVGLQKIKYIL